MRFGQGGHHLAQCGAERLVEAERGMGALGGEDEEGTGLVGGEPGDIGAEPGQQRDAAVPPALGVDRDAGGGQRLDVAVDGAYGDFEALGQLGGGHQAAGLEQQEDREQPVGFHRTSFSRPPPAPVRRLRPSPARPAAAVRQERGARASWRDWATSRSALSQTSASSSRKPPARLRVVMETRSGPGPGGSGCGW